MANFYGMFGVDWKVFSINTFACLDVVKSVVNKYNGCNMILNISFMVNISVFSLTICQSKPLYLYLLS